MLEALSSLVWKIDAKLSAIYGLAATLFVRAILSPKIKDFVMSWTSQFFRSILNGSAGLPAVTNTNSTSPIVPALNGFNQAGAALGSTLMQAAEICANSYLEAHVGPQGTAVADLALLSLIQTATAKLSPEAADHLTANGPAQALTPAIPSVPVQSAS